VQDGPEAARKATAAQWRAAGARNRSSRGRARGARSRSVGGQSSETPNCPRRAASSPGRAARRICMSLRKGKRRPSGDEDAESPDTGLDRRRSRTTCQQPAEPGRARQGVGQRAQAKYRSKVLRAGRPPVRRRLLHAGGPPSARPRRGALARDASSSRGAQRSVDTAGKKGRTGYRAGAWGPRRRDRESWGGPTTSISLGGPASPSRTEQGPPRKQHSAAPAR